LFIQAVERKTVGRGRFLAARADFVDGVEGVAEDAVCVAFSVCYTNMVEDRSAVRTY
jgi:hypothetical protein